LASETRSSKLYSNYTTSHANRRRRQYPDNHKRKMKKKMKKKRQGRLQNAGNIN